MKKFIVGLIVSAAVMFVLPCFTVTFIKGDHGMAVCFLLFFTVNPAFELSTGWFAGKQLKKLWALPLITAIFFLISCWLLFDPGEPAFLLYAVSYLVLGTVSMLISMLVRGKHLPKNRKSS